MNNRKQISEKQFKHLLERAKKYDEEHERAESWKMVCLRTMAKMDMPT